MIYAVIDTNVLVSALLSKNGNSPPVRVYNAIIFKSLTPLYSKEMLNEYDDVLYRPKFAFEKNKIQSMINNIISFGVEVFPKPTGEILIDMDDLVFYEVAMEKSDVGSYLVTGNQKHYPVRDFIVTPAEMIKILEMERLK